MAKEKKMKQARRLSQELWLYPVIGFALITASACHSSPASSGSREVGVRTASDSAGTHIDVMCMGDRITNPPGALHYSYKYEDASGLVDKEADITPQTMDITIQDKSGLHKYHGVRSDEGSWSSAVLNLSGLNITTMSARLDSLNRTSAIVQQGAEVINGASATRYAIDTKGANASDKNKFETFFGKSSFEKGTVWMGEDGCAVKLVLDEGVWQTNGEVNQVHYEMAIIKK